MQRSAIVVQHLDHDGPFLAFLHGGAVEAEMVPQDRRAVGVAAELVARQELTTLVAFVGRDLRAADFDQADRRSLGKMHVGQGELADAAPAAPLRAMRCKAASARARKSAGQARSQGDAAADGGGDLVLRGIANLVIGDEIALADFDRGGMNLHWLNHAELAQVADMVVVRPRHDPSRALGARTEAEM